MADRFYALMEMPEGDLAAVGPFSERDEAGDWGDENENAHVTMRGTVIGMSRTAFRRDAVHKYGEEAER